MKENKVHNRRPAIIPMLEGKIVTHIYCGGAHSIWVTSNQAIYSFGLNNNGQLGLGDPIHHVDYPEKIRQFTSFSIKSIACGDEMTLFLTANKDLFACGWNGAKQFLCIESPNIYYPTQIDSNKLFGGKTGNNLSKIFASDKTIVFLWGSNRLYQWGSIIGDTSGKISEEPILIKSMDKNIVDVIWARSQIFVTANEKLQEIPKPKKDENLMKILSNNKIFHTQKYENKFPAKFIKDKDLKKILQEKKKALLEEREK